LGWFVTQQKRTGRLLISFRIKALSLLPTKPHKIRFPLSYSTSLIAYYSHIQHYPTLELLYFVLYAWNAPSSDICMASSLTSFLSLLKYHLIQENLSYCPNKYPWHFLPMPLTLLYIFLSLLSLDIYINHLSLICNPSPHTHKIPVYAPKEQELCVVHHCISGTRIVPGIFFFSITRKMLK
jgi:hypothetical protein